jgi:hypothetical protein
MYRLCTKQFSTALTVDVDLTRRKGLHWQQVLNMENSPLQLKEILMKVPDDY